MFNAFILLLEDLIEDSKSVLETVQDLAPDDFPFVRTAAAYGLAYLDVVGDLVNKL
jgi:uncharacterized surface anchored protein